MEKNKVIKLVPLIIAFVGIVICLASFFLPYASATSDHEKQLSDHIDGMYISEIGMTNGDAIGISPFEFLNINIYGAQNFSGRNQTVAIICVAMISAIAVFTLLCILFAALRKPVPLREHLSRVFSAKKIYFINNNGNKPTNRNLLPHKGSSMSKIRLICKCF